jgi:hypothetical protein
MAKAINLVIASHFGSLSIALFVHPITMKTTTIIDPLGNLVFLPDNLVSISTIEMNRCAIYDQPEKVIAHPAMMLSGYAEPQENIYYRSIGWHETLLIRTRKENGRWIAFNAIRNPSTTDLNQFYKQSKQLI